MFMFYFVNNNTLVHIYQTAESKKPLKFKPAYIPIKPHPNIKQNKYAHTISSKSALIIVSIKQYGPLPIALNSEDDINP